MHIPRNQADRADLAANTYKTIWRPSAPTTTCGYKWLAYTFRSWQHDLKNALLSTFRSFGAAKVEHDAPNPSALKIMFEGKAFGSCPQTKAPSLVSIAIWMKKC